MDGGLIFTRQEAKQITRDGERILALAEKRDITWRLTQSMAWLKSRSGREIASHHADSIA
jgi:hypothetical protein